MSITRRRFLATAAATGALLAVPAIRAQEKARRYRTALVGSGWWGMNIARVAIASGECDLVALSDVDQNQLAPAVKEAEKLTATAPKSYEDYRELLDREKPEIVICATPDHWHPLVTIDAVRAGAHVYVEKPISHTIHEGWSMVKAARAADRVVQVGTHRRVSPHNVSAMRFLKEGKAGRIGAVRAFVNYGGKPGEPVPDSEPPRGLNWDLWCGPAPLVPFNKAIHPKGFRRFLHYANGQLGDWGIHWMDQILWWTDQPFPHAVSSTGGRHLWTDNSDAPDTQYVHYAFDGFTATWEHRWYGGNEAEKHNVGCYFYGTEGTLHLGWLDGWTFYPRNKGGEVLHEEPQLHQPDQQNIPELWADFLAAIRERQRPVCDIEIGHRSTNMALLGMLSLKLGRSVRWDGGKEQIVDDAQANQLLRRQYRDPWVYPDPEKIG